MFRLICAVLLLSAAAVHASMTAAWKVPVELYASLSEEGSRKLTAPPGASAFFHPGDELWDIAEQVMWHSPASLHDREGKPEPWPGEWLVWNARSGMIVARGSEIDLLLLDQTLDVLEKSPSFSARSSKRSKDRRQKPGSYRASQRTGRSLRQSYRSSRSR